MADGTVAVVGGGPAGLVAARHLAEAGLDVRLFERRDEVGGRVRSERTDGYVFDRGFQVLFTAYPAARRELDFDALDLRRFAPGAVVCRPNHRSVLADPFRDPGALFETLANRDVTLGDKLRVLRLRRELREKSRAELLAGPDGTIAEYLDDRGFSRKFVENFAAPFYGGITLDRSLATSRKVFEFTFAMLSRGEAAVPAAGMEAVADQLVAAAADAGATVETEREVRAIDGDGDGAGVALPGEAVSADAAVVATDPPTARELTGVDAVPTDARGCVTQYYALPEGYDLGSDGRVLVNAGGRDPNQVVPLSAVAPEYAPDDVTLVSATFLGEREESDDELASLTRDALSAWYPEFVFEDLDLLRSERVPFAQFAQPPGVHESLPDVRDGPARCYLAGEYVGGPSSIDAALASGREAADAVVADLEEAP